MAGRTGRTAALIAGLSATLAPLVAQTARLEIRLAADPDRHGPAAWTWVRASLIRTLSPSITDPFGGLSVSTDEAPGAGFAITALTAPTDDYLQFTLTTASGARVEGRSDFSGRESWTVPAGLDIDALPAAARSLCSRFGYEARTGWLALDLSTLVGDLMLGAIDGDPTSEALTLGAAECGAVAVLARRGAGDTLSVEGCSDGGLLLPALLIALADRQAGRADRALPLAEDVDRWLLLAASAEREEQEEAARQLGRFKDPRSIRALERLLHGDGMVRAIAMHSLVRLGSSRSLGAIVAAADPRFPDTVALAADAVWTLVPVPVAAELVHSAPHAPAAGPTAEGVVTSRYGFIDILLSVGSFLTLLSVVALVWLERKQELHPSRA